MFSHDIFPFLSSQQLQQTATGTQKPEEAVSTSKTRLNVGLKHETCKDFSKKIDNHGDLVSSGEAPRGR